MNNWIAVTAHAPHENRLNVLTATLRRAVHWRAQMRLPAVLLLTVLPSIGGCGSSPPKADRATIVEVLTKYENSVSLFAANDDVLDIRSVVVRGQLMGADLYWLEKMPGIESLKFETSAIRSWEYLRNLPNLRVLDAKEARISTSTIELLAEMAPEIQALTFGCNINSTGDSYISSLSQFSNLKMLRMKDLTPPAGRSFGEVPNLEALWVDNIRDSRSTQQMFNSCADHKKMRFLALHGGLYFGQGPRVVTCDPLSTCPKLTGLLMSGNDDIKELSVIQSLTTLRRLKGLWCEISPKIIDQARVEFQNSMPGVYKGRPFGGESPAPRWEDFMPTEQESLRKVVIGRNGDLLFAN